METIKNNIDRMRQKFDPFLAISQTQNINKYRQRRIFRSGIPTPTTTPTTTPTVIYDSDIPAYAGPYKYMVQLSSLYFGNDLSKMIKNGNEFRVILERKTRYIAKETAPSRYRPVGKSFMVGFVFWSLLDPDNVPESPISVDYNLIASIAENLLFKLKLDEIKDTWINIMNNIANYIEYKYNTINIISEKPDFNIIEKYIIAEPIPQCNNNATPVFNYNRNILRTYLETNSLFRSYIFGPDGDIQWLFNNYKTFTNLIMYVEVFSVLTTYIGLSLQWYQEYCLVDFDIITGKPINPWLSRYIGFNTLIGQRQKFGTLLGELQNNIIKLNDVYIYIMNSFKSGLDTSISRFRTTYPTSVFHRKSNNKFNLLCDFDKITLRNGLETIINYSDLAGVNSFDQKFSMSPTYQRIDTTSLEFDTLGGYPFGYQKNSSLSEVNSAIKNNNSNFNIGINIFIGNTFDIDKFTPCTNGKGNEVLSSVTDKFITNETGINKNFTKSKCPNNYTQIYSAFNFLSKFVDEDSRYIVCTGNPEYIDYPLKQEDCSNYNPTLTESFTFKKSNVWAITDVLQYVANTIYTDTDNIRYRIVSTKTPTPDSRLTNIRQSTVGILLKYENINSKSNTSVLINLFERSNIITDVTSRGSITLLSTGSYKTNMTFYPINLAQYFVSYINFDTGMVNPKDATYNKTVYYKDADDKYVTLPIIDSCSALANSRQTLFYAYNSIYKNNYQYAQDNNIASGVYKEDGRII
jgi:hypothetical protein